MEHIFLDDQITIPEEFPTILKDYAKAAIKTNPTDLLSWSLKYFTALSNGEEPPVRERLKSKKSVKSFIMMNEPEIASVEKKTQKLAEDVAVTTLDYICSLNIDDVPDYTRLTKIVCTIGPATEDVDNLVGLMEAGMNVARLNFSHGTYEYHGNVANNVREAAKKMAKKRGLESYPIAIALDTKGPEIRTGYVEGGPTAEVKLEKGSTVKITTDQSYFEKCSADTIYVDYKNIIKVLKEGDKMYIDDGIICLKVKKVEADHLECEILNGSMLGSQKGCNLPGVEVDLPAVSDKDKEDLLFGIEVGVDMIFASFIRNADGVKEIRKVLGDKGKHILIISKIENHEGVHKFQEIIEVSDGLMVARGDLGINIPTEKIFLAQKQIIAKCNIAGKPVICATQMLDSMTTKPRPTRAESLDVANAVLDGADGVMLSGESAKGQYPALCVETMNSIANQAEYALNQRVFYDNLLMKELIPVDPLTTTAIAAVSASMKCLASAIVVLTKTGKSAHRVAKYRPRCPILAVTRSDLTTRQCQLHRAIFAIHFTGERLPEWVDDVEFRIKYAFDIGKKWNYLKSGDTVVIVIGWRKGSGATNTIRVINIE